MIIVAGSMSFDPADRADRPGAWDEHGGLAAFVAEQVLGVDSARSPAGHQRLRGDGGVEFAQRAVVPGAEFVVVDDGGDGGRAGRGHAAMADVGARRVLGVVKQVPQRGDRVLGAGEAVLKPAEVRRDQLVAGTGVGRGEDALDLVDRHVQLPEPPDYLRGGDLVCGVTAVPGELVHISGFEQSHSVVVAQRLDAHVCRAGKVADR